MKFQEMDQDNWRAIVEGSVEQAGAYLTRVGMGIPKINSTMVDGWLKTTIGCEAEVDVVILLSRLQDEKKFFDLMVMVAEGDVAVGQFKAFIWLGKNPGDPGIPIHTRNSALQRNQTMVNCLLKVTDTICEVLQSMALDAEATEVTRKARDEIHACFQPTTEVQG